MTDVLEVLDVDSVRRWVVMTRAALAARRTEIDALNVYPVPDGDTGTNMYLTLDEALAGAMREQEALGVVGEAPLAVEVAVMSRSALMSARGNSGVILSQLVRGVSEVVSSESLDEVDAAAVGRAVRQGARRARESVVRPQEGTILTVADATADAVEAALVGGATLGEVTRAAVEAARAALARTPEQLQVLRDAGVVDAGERATCSSSRRSTRSSTSRVRPRSTPSTTSPSTPRSSGGPTGPPPVPGRSPSRGGTRDRPTR